MTYSISHTPIGSHTASALHFPGDGPALHFYHANGFGPACYQPFLQSLATKYDVHALEMRPFWPSKPHPLRHRGWDQYADDLIAWLDANGLGPILAVAHSMGSAATAMAAVKRPDLFRGLVLIEPSGATRRIATMMRLLPYGLRSRLGPAPATFHRRAHWPDRAAAFAELRAIPAYKRFDDDALATLVDNITEEDTHGITLRFSPRWEGHNFVTPPHTLPALKALTVPTRIIAAKPSLFVPPESLAALAKVRPDIPFTHLPDRGHLFPLEVPAVAADLALEALSHLQAPSPSANVAA
ncbi:alpha/beta hydrolase [Shimia sp. CNT1-13L.2]|uniref:alpha/beta hydrolase n=1 Tax=Shimia sp. CNT1-13L.2 TaxID=2959663 RepID=UPI0020CE9D37|nr:alpha/beta hydrolase [Shimia sp. CNT1-13L.2]MCP9482000.1 alpha/beta hydrolase [Shimia sp. CNT1-13L.2]